MHVRISTVTGANDIDAGAAHVRDAVVPQVRELSGFRGLTMSADRAATTTAVLTRWETGHDLEASAGAAGKARQETVAVIGGEVSVEVFEEVASEVGVPPEPGCVLRLREVRMSPASADDNIAFFRAQVIPFMTATPGFRAVRFVLDRQTGRGFIGVVFSDEGALRAGDAGFERGREEARATRGVEFGTTSVREVLVVAM
jgi:heme-degrading monooxygenase HmoA